MTFLFTTNVQSIRKKYFVQFYHWKFQRMKWIAGKLNSWKHYWSILKAKLTTWYQWRRYLTLWICDVTWGSVSTVPLLFTLLCDNVQLFRITNSDALNSTWNVEQNKSFEVKSKMYLPSTVVWFFGFIRNSTFVSFLTMSLTFKPGVQTRRHSNQMHVTHPRFTNLILLTFSLKLCVGFRILMFSWIMEPLIHILRHKSEYFCCCVMFHRLICHQLLYQLWASFRLKYFSRM